MWDRRNRSVDVSRMTELGLKLIALTILGFVTVKAQDMPEFSERLDGREQNEDANLTTIRLIRKYGYHGETHQVTTDDGYILEMHRITGPKGNPCPKGKHPVFLMHGILSSSADWVITGPDRAFAYILADEGYDVWMGNARGNTFSRSHVNYTTLDKEYWQFSWHEIGCNDLPAMIDYILKETNRAKLIYVGHGQGTTTFWVMATQRPEYQDKVNVMFALAPVAYLTHVRCYFTLILSTFVSRIEELVNLFGIFEVTPNNPWLKKFQITFCPEKNSLMCSNIFFLIAGPISDQLNKTMLPAILGHVPAGGSIKQLLHYGQLIDAQEFQQYDHGKMGNFMIYGRSQPPIYDLSIIKTPVSLHYSTNDIYVTPEDVDRLQNMLGNPIGKFLVPYENFTHTDFVWANEGKQLIYDQVVSMMERYRN